MQTMSWKLILVIPFMLLYSLSYAVAADTNTVRSITTLSTGEIEIAVTSTRAFPVRNQLVSLHIGDKTFSRSRSPADGSLNTLIFLVPGDEFKKVASGDSMTVQFGNSQMPGDKWDFGALNKRMLAR